MVSINSFSVLCVMEPKNSEVGSGLDAQNGKNTEQMEELADKKIVCFSL